MAKKNTTRKAVANVKAKKLESKPSFGFNIKALTKFLKLKLRL